VDKPAVLHVESLSTFRLFAQDYFVTRQRDRTILHIDASWRFGADRERSESPAIPEEVDDETDGDSVGAIVV